MPIKGNKFSINLNQSINTDTFPVDVKNFDDNARPVDGNFIHRDGGLTNNYLAKEEHTIEGRYFYTDKGTKIVVKDDGAVYINDQLYSNVGKYSVRDRLELGQTTDVVLAEDHYVKHFLTGNTITISKFDYNETKLAEREVTFPNLGAIFQVLTSINAVRNAEYSYEQQQEYALRFGDQIAFISEANPDISISTVIQSTGVVGGAPVTVAYVYGDSIVFASNNGRVGSFDGTNWKNYDGTGSGIGPFNNATVLGAVSINAIHLYGTQLVFAGASGRLGSFDGGNWKNYDGTGTGTGPSDNGTLIGTNTINALSDYDNILVVGGDGGRIGCIIGTTKYVYTTAVTTLTPTKAYILPVSNGTVISTNAVTNLTTITDSDNTPVLLVSGSNTLASFKRGWTTSSGTTIPANQLGTPVDVQFNTETKDWGNIITGNGVQVALRRTASNTVYTSTDGEVWTARTLPSSLVARGTEYGVFIGGRFYIQGSTGSDRRYVLTSYDGITWTSVIDINTVTNTADGVFALRKIVILPDQSKMLVSLYRPGGGNNPGSGGAANLYSTNGINWTKCTGVGVGAFSDVIISANSNFVAVTDIFITVFTSPDAITWTSRSIPLSGLQNPADSYGVGDLVLKNVGSTIVLASNYRRASAGAYFDTWYSTNNGVNWTGTTWSTAPASTSSNMLYVFNNTFISITVSTSTTNSVYTSTDGITWTVRTGVAGQPTYFNNNKPEPYQRNMIITSGFLLFTNVNTLSTSSISHYYTTNGTSYTGVNSGANAGVSNIFFMPINGQIGLFYSTATDNKLVSFPIARNSGLFGTTSGSNVKFIKYSNKLVTASNTGQVGNVNTTGTILPSGAGRARSTVVPKILMLPSTITPDATIRYAASSPTRTIITGNGTNNTMFYTTDGDTWTRLNSPAPAGSNISAIAYGSSKFVVSRDSSTSKDTYIYTSTDGSSWTSRSLPTLPNTSPKYLAYANGTFILVCNGTNTTGIIYTSPDGITWTARSTSNPLNVFPSGVAYCAAANKWIIGTGSLYYLYSSDNGATWTERLYSTGGGPGGTTLKDVMATNDYFIIASSDTMWRSTDGLTWSTSSATTPTAATNNMWAIDNKTLWALDYNNTTKISTYYVSANNGTNWNKVTEDPYCDITAVGILIAGCVGNKVLSLRGRYSSYNTGLVFPDATPNTLYSTSVVGTTAVAALSIFNGSILYVATASTIGTYDGTNWKNSNGTGTGTGGYMSGKLPGVNITAAGYLNSYMFYGTNTGAVYTSNSSMVFSTEATSGSNTAAGANNNNAIFAWKYADNNGYLWHVVNAEDNNVYYCTLANLNNAFYSTLKGKYVWPTKIPGNKYAKLFITETPRGDSSNIYAFSTHGFNGYNNTFTATQTYVGTGENVTSVLGGVVGWNYADASYTISGSATNKYNYLAPAPVQSPTTYYQKTQGNINNLILGYSKLSNVRSIPAEVEFRVIWQQSGSTAYQSHISAAVTDGQEKDNMGVLLTPVGEFDDSYTPQYIVNGNTYRLLYRYQGSFFVITVDDGDKNIQRIDSNLYKINTLSPLNLYSDNDRRFYISSVDYNGRVQWNYTGTSTDTTLIASYYYGKYSSSVDVGAKITNLPSSATIGNAIPIGIKIPYAVNLTDYAIDVFKNGTYLGSYNSASKAFIDPNTSNTVYVQSTILPTPQGFEINNGLLSTDTSTIILNKDFDGYNLGNEVNGDYTSFILFGQTFLFDGLSIYSINVINNILQSSEKVADAYGLKYIASSPEQIFFLSSFDNSLYTFNGGRSLQKVQIMSQLPEIKSGVFNAYDSTLYLDTNEYLITVRDNIISKIRKDLDIVNTTLVSTKDGVLLYDDDATYRYSYKPLPNSEVVPLMYQTPYFGLNLSEKLLLADAVFTFYNSEKVPMDVKVTTYAYDESRSNEKIANFSIKSTDYTDNGVTKIRVQPVKGKVLGISFKVETNTKTLLTEVDLNFTPVEPAVPRNTK